MKKLLFAALALFALTPKVNASPLYGYVQITTTTALTPNLQSGAIKIASGTINNLNASTGSFTGTVTASTFSGNGSSLTNIPGANVTGLLPVSTMANVLASTNSWSAQQTFSSATVTNLAVSSMTTTLPMSAHKITGLANGSASTDAMAFGQVTAMTVQRFTSGVGTYTTPTSPRTPSYLVVKLLGAGGSGSGSGTAGGTTPGNGAAGNNTWFGVSVATAAGGGGGNWNSTGGAGNTNTIGSGTTLVNAAGTPGTTDTFIAASGNGVSGGNGGSSLLGPGGAGGATGTTGASATANSGGGGQGGGTGSGAASLITGSGGGSGGYVELLITSPAASYNYSIGAGGTPGGSAGTTGNVGGTGGSGLIIVEEHYQ